MKLSTALISGILAGIIIHLPSVCYAGNSVDEVLYSLQTNQIKPSNDDVSRLTNQTIHDPGPVIPVREISREIIDPGPALPPVREISREIIDPGPAGPTATTLD